MDFICIPLFQALATLLPKLQPIVDNVAYNRAQWTALLDKYPERQTTQQARQLVAICTRL